MFKYFINFAFMKGMLIPICLFESEGLTFACNPNINLIVYGKNEEQAINEFRTAFALMMDCCDNLGALDTLIADCSLPIDKFFRTKFFAKLLYI